MNKHTRIIVHVNEQAQKDTFYTKSEEIGKLAARAFLDDERKDDHQKPGQNPAKDQKAPDKKELDKHRSQMTSLENIAETTRKVTDVLDFIKKQIGRPNQIAWRKEYEGQRFGETLKQYIENDIKAIANDVYIDVREVNELERQHIYLLLVRQCIRQIVAQYEYSISHLIEEKRQQHDQQAGTGTDTTPQRH